MPRRTTNITQGATPQRPKRFKKAPKGESGMKHAHRNRGIPR